MTRRPTRSLYHHLEEALTRAAAPRILPIDDEQLERFRALGDIR